MLKYKYVVATLWLINISVKIRKREHHGRSEK